jgi:hypothetical protein
MDNLLVRINYIIVNSKPQNQTHEPKPQVSLRHSGVLVPTSTAALQSMVHTLPLSLTHTPSHSRSLVSPKSQLDPKPSTLHLDPKIFNPKPCTPLVPTNTAALQYMVSPYALARPQN